MSTPPDPLRDKVLRLDCWRHDPTAERLGGGITNVNFRVRDGEHSFVVRLGGDIPVHQVMRFNELAASRAAHAAGVGPEVVHAESGVLVIRFIAGRVFAEADVRQRANLARIVDLIRRLHHDGGDEMRGPALVFWVFHVLRHYAHVLKEGNSAHLPALPRLMDKARTLERAVGPVDLVLGHNDLLPANLIDDGTRLWLIDYDYAGFNSPLFDLGNLASNNGLDEADERWLLEAYYGRSPGDALWRSYGAMKCASLLRETLWSMVSEIHSAIDFDYAAYTAENLDRFNRTYAALDQELEFR